jgi:hypothetical protein
MIRSISGAREEYILGTSAESDNLYVLATGVFGQSQLEFVNGLLRVWPIAQKCLLFRCVNTQPLRRLQFVVLRITFANRFGHRSKNWENSERR